MDSGTLVNSLPSNSEKPLQGGLKSLEKERLRIDLFKSQEVVIVLKPKLDLVSTDPTTFPFFNPR